MKNEIVKLGRARSHKSDTTKNKNHKTDKKIV